MTEGNGQLAGREALLSPCKRRHTIEDIPGVGRCRFQSLSERERSQWEQRLRNKRGDVIPAREREVRRALVALSWVDGDGARVLSDEDIKCDAFDNADMLPVAKMAAAVMAHCGLDESDIEDSEKNSEATPDD